MNAFSRIKQASAAPAVLPSVMEGFKNLFSKDKLDLNLAPFNASPNPAGGAPSNAVIAPLSNTGGATVGGLGGAALGGLAGLGRAAFDGEDDGILSTLRKALVGAGVGGLGGAAIGAGASTLARNGAVDKIVGRNPEKFDTAAKRDSVDAVTRRLEVPVGDFLKTLTGRMPKGNAMDQLNKSTTKTNARETIMHALAPMLAADPGVQVKGVPLSDAAAALSARLPEIGEVTKEAARGDQIMKAIKKLSETAKAEGMAGAAGDRFATMPYLGYGKDADSTWSARRGLVSLMGASPPHPGVLASITGKAIGRPDIRADSKEWMDTWQRMRDAPSSFTLEAAPAGYDPGVGVGKLDKFLSGLTRRLSSGSASFKKLT